MPHCQGYRAQEHGHCSGDVKSAESHSQEHYVTGGYFLARPIPRPSYLPVDLLPEKIFSASHCIGRLIPDNWRALNWEGLDEKQRREDAPRLGVEKAQIPELVRWVNERWRAEQLGWGDVFYSADVARSFVGHFRLSIQDLVLFSIALHRDYTNLFIAETRSPEKIIPSGISLMVQKAIPIEEGGEALGYDVLGYQLAWSHSWLCYGFAKEANEKLGIRPNSHGFIQTPEDAKKVADLANRSDAPSEYKPYLPWLVTLHSIRR